MNNLRRYGNKPFKIAILHGGPGAPGEMAPVARKLSADRGVLELLQTKDTIKGQVDELKAVLEENGDIPVTLVGFSWGAMLGFIFAARCPSLVRKLILIGSGVYEDKYALSITKTRLSRLGKEERMEVILLMEALESPAVEDTDTLMARLGELISIADTYDPLPNRDEALACRYHIFQKVWEEASELRSSGKLLKLGEKIQCPVVAIHGDYDPHPVEGVKDPLKLIIKDFHFILLEHCGHRPWLEKAARDRFYDILKNEIEP